MTLFWGVQFLWACLMFSILGGLLRRYGLLLWGNAQSTDVWGCFGIRN